MDLEDNIIEEPKELDLRSELKNAFDNATGDEPEKKSRKRSDDGKFAPEPKEEVVKDKSTDNLSPEPKEEIKPAIKPPLAWSPESKTKFAELPEWAQKETLRREEEVHKGFTKFDEERQFGKQLKEVITPYMHIITAEGGTPLTAVQDLLNTAYILRTAPPHQKEQLFHRLAQQYGVNIGQPIGQNIDPTVQALQEQVSQLTGYINQTVNTQKQQEQNTINGQIEAFAADPKNIHFETVKGHMAALLQNGLAEDLQDAYDQAVYAKPDIRATLLSAQTQDTEAKRIADTKAKAEAARRAGGSVTGSPGLSAPANGSHPDRSLRDDLRANFRAFAS